MPGLPSSDLTWFRRYRAAAMRCTELAERETDNLTKQALMEAASRFIMMAIDHEEILLRHGSLSPTSSEKT